MTVLLQDIWKFGGCLLVHDLGSIGTRSRNRCSCGVKDVRDVQLRRWAEHGSNGQSRT